MTDHILPSRIFDTTKTYKTKTGSVFLESNPGLLDSINKRLPTVWALYKKLKTLDWDENEQSYRECRTEFANDEQGDAETMLLTIAWQWETDSLAAHHLVPLMAPFVSSSEYWVALGRIHDNECLIDGTEALTPTGWVDLKDITTQTLVAQYSPETKSIEFVHPSAVFEKHYRGTMYAFSSFYKHVHQVVTPNHRMLNVQQGGAKRHIVGFAEDVDYQRGSAHNQNSFIVAGHLQNKNSRDALSFTERLFIAIQADGSISDRYDGSRVGTVPVWFGLSKERKIKRLLRLAEEIGWELTELTGSPGRNENIKDQRRFKLAVPVEYADCLKNFKWLNFVDKSSAWCEDFLEEIICWDGHRAKNTGILHTTSREAADACQVAASLAGMKTHLGHHVDKRSETYSDTWRVTWKKQDYVSGQNIYKSATDYDGMVRCLTVPSSFFLTRYKDSVTVSGNSIHALTYSEIVREAVPNSDEIMGEILARLEPLKRMNAVARVMAETMRVGAKINLGEISRDDPVARDTIMIFLITLFCMERVQFMISFAVTFAYAEAGRYVPVGKQVQKICNDEYNIHAEVGREVLRNELSTEVGRASYERIKDQVAVIVKEIGDTEMRFAREYLFPNGKELVGCNAELLCEFGRYCLTDVYNELPGIDNPFGNLTKNPIGYMEDWVNLDNNQPAPQEEKPMNYLLGGFIATANGKVYDTAGLC